MHDARDAEDKRLLETGELTLLVESYYGVMLDRCRARVWPEDGAIAVAAEVAIRLLSELKRGRRYRVPFRVVVHKVIGWKGFAARLRLFRPRLSGRTDFSSGAIQPCPADGAPRTQVAGGLALLPFLPTNMVCGASDGVLAGGPFQGRSELSV